MDGPISYINTRRPTDDELNKAEYFVATSSNEWNPHSECFQDNEESTNRSAPQPLRLGDPGRVVSSFESVSGTPPRGDTTRFKDDGDISREDLYSLLHTHEVARLRNLSVCSTRETNAQVYRHLVTPECSDPRFSFHSEERVISSIHTSLYEEPYSDNFGNSELARSSPEVVNISSVHRNYKPSGNYAKRRKLEIPTGELLDEQYIDRRVRWGPKGDNSARRAGITPKELAKRWGIGENRAAETIRVTTQKGVRNLSNPLVRRMKTQKWRNRRVLKGKWFSDTMHFTTKSIVRQEKAAQVFTNGKGFDEFYPIERECKCSDGLMRMVNEAGIPEHLVVDGARAQGSHETYNTNWQNVVKAYNIHQTWIQPHCWWQNLAEKCIGEIRKEMRRLTSAKSSPKRLWGYLGCFVAAKRQRTASNIPSMMGRTGFEVVHGYTPDISLFILHDWYDFVHWYDLSEKTEKLGRWLGPSGEAFGGGDCHYILSHTGKIHVTNSTRPVREDEWRDRDILQRMDKIDISIQSKIGDDVKPEEALRMNEEPSANDLFDDDDSPLIEEEDATMPDADEYTPEQYDEYIGTEVLLSAGSEQLQGIVKRRTHDLSGHPIGLRNSNPILDTRSYQVQLPDGSVDTYGANIIAESIMSGVDDEGNLFVLMDEIIDHRKNGDEISENDAWYTTKSGTKRRKPTTKGWELLISWKDGTSSWARLADMKESFPVEVADYAKDNQIIGEPAFAWWCHKVLRRRKRLISGAKTKYWLKTHKYGIRLPKSIKEALQIDRETGTDMWAKAIAKEMKNVIVTFEFTEEDVVPRGHQKITVHTVFDVKITLQRKA